MLSFTAGVLKYKTFVFLLQISLAMSQNHLSLVSFQTNVVEKCRSCKRATLNKIKLHKKWNYIKVQTLHF